MRGNHNQVDILNRLLPYKVCINPHRRPERYQRMSKDYKYLTETGETFIKAAMIRDRDKLHLSRSRLR